RRIDRNYGFFPLRVEVSELADLLVCPEVGPSPLDRTSGIDNRYAGRLRFAPGEINPDKFQSADLLAGSIAACPACWICRYGMVHECSYSSFGNLSVQPNVLADEAAE